jgi:hypothetical protein
MPEIDYARDYGYSPGSPLWVTWRGEGYVPATFASREEAEADAAQCAIMYPGQTIHVLAAMASVSTSPKVVGQRFDPSRAARIAVPEFPEVDPPATPLATEEEPI